MNLICPKREPPTFNTLSEDVVSSIFAHISSWADLESTGADWEEKRKQGQKWVDQEGVTIWTMINFMSLGPPSSLSSHMALNWSSDFSYIFRATDLTLRAIVLSSRASYQRWVLHLIRHVTVSNISMASIYLLLQRRFDLGRFIKFIKIEGNPDNVTEESSVPFMILWEALDDSAQRKLTQQETTRVFLTSIFRSTENLETLLLSNGVFSFPLVDRVGTQTLPFRFMTQALKRLHISKPDSDDITGMHSAQNMVWLLVSCSHLLEASLCFTANSDSFNYLNTYSNTFQGRSKVRKLAIRLYIVWDGIKNGVGRWNGVHGNEGSWMWVLVAYETRSAPAPLAESLFLLFSSRGGNLETETAYRFLLVTNQLFPSRSWAVCLLERPQGTRDLFFESQQILWINETSPFDYI